MKDKNNFFISAMEFKKRHPRIVLVILIFFVIPVASSFILGSEMKKEVAFHIPTVVCDLDNSSFTRRYIQSINETQAFDVVKEVKTYQEVNEEIRRGHAMAGLIIPENFYKNLKSGDSPKMLSIFDGSTLAVLTTSKTSMVEMLLDSKLKYMSHVYQKEQSKVPMISEKMTKPLNFTTRILYNPAKNFRNFLIPGMLIAILQVAITMNGAEIGYETRMNNIKMSRRFYDIFKWALVGSISILIVLIIQWVFFNVPLRGSLIGFLSITYIYAVVMTTFGYVFGIIIPDRAFASQLSCVFVLPTSILGGYTWPILAMPKGIQQFTKFLPYTYYGNNIRSICLKPLKFRHLVDDINALLIYFGVLMLLIYLFTKIREKGNYERKIAK